MHVTAILCWTVQSKELGGRSSLQEKEKLRTKELEFQNGYIMFYNDGNELVDLLVSTTCCHGCRVQKIHHYSMNQGSKNRHADPPSNDEMCIRIYPHFATLFYFCPIHGHCLGLPWVHGGEGRKDCMTPPLYAWWWSLMSHTVSHQLLRDQILYFHVITRQLCSRYRWAYWWGIFIYLMKVLYVHPN